MVQEPTSEQKNWEARVLTHATTAPNSAYMQQREHADASLADGFKHTLTERGERERWREREREGEREKQRDK